MGKVYQLMQTGRGIVPGLVCGCVIEIEKNLVSSEYNFCSPFFKTYPEPIGFPRIVGVYATTTKLTLLSRRQTIQRPYPRLGPDPAFKIAIFTRRHFAGFKKNSFYHGKKKRRREGGTWLSGSGIEKKQKNSLRNFCWREPTTPTTSIKLKFIEKKKIIFKAGNVGGRGGKGPASFYLYFRQTIFLYSKKSGEEAQKHTHSRRRR